MTTAFLPWRVVACHVELPADWRERLVRNLGERPRRLGVFGELALYGATACLAQAGVATLPGRAMLRVASRSACASATVAALEQLESGGPQPFTFLQGQPSQSLAALSRALRWQGDASFLIDEAPEQAARLACCEAAGRELLLGWVNDLPQAETRWYWLRQSADERLPVFTPETFQAF
ncbi:hypothetical protein [Uliginosibacterium sp. H1]|uniref:hypothetical protein n=1 Tax=Uliginosibacterium sp. H1 TaxID=3114757 RepID=UPI002E17C8B9|nr:hypothetical protein [Uliginosibacterium sp. H1]